MAALVPTGSIGWAVTWMQGGKKVRRKGWPENVWIELWPPSLSGHRVYMNDTLTGSMIEWHCSDEDLIAEDWEVAHWE